MNGAGGKARPFPWLWFLLAFLAIILVAGAPVWSAMTAGMIASANGCDLHEGFVNPCIIGGSDWGETLYAMLVFAWFAMLTLPVGALALVAWAVVLVTMFIARSAGKAKRPE